MKTQAKFLVVLSILFFTAFQYQAKANVFTITQQGNSFIPAVLNNVNVGDTILFVWTSGVHTTTSFDIPLKATPWNSYLSSDYPVYQYIVSIPGVYNYISVMGSDVEITGSFTVNLPGNTINGILSYANSASSGLPSSVIYFRNLADNSTYTTNTGSAGEYSISDIPDGTYEIDATTAVKWGGVNSTDALAMIKQYVLMEPLSGLHLTAANVDNASIVNSVDALYACKRFVELMNSFPVGDWYFQPQILTVSGNGTFTADLQGICYGDADGSYTSFVLKTPSSVDIQQNTSIVSTNGKSISLPLILTQNTVVGAVSLDLNLPKSKAVVENIVMAENQGNLFFNQTNDQVKISWFSATPLTIQANKPLLYITLKTTTEISAENPLLIALAGNSELADANAGVISNVTIEVPKVLAAAVTTNSTESGVKGFTIAPNPVTDNNCNIYLTSSTSTNSSIKVFSLTGKEVSSSSFEITSGSNTTSLDFSKLTAGIYFVQMKDEQGNIQSRKVIKK